MLWSPCHVSVVGSGELCVHSFFSLGFCCLDGFAEGIAGLLIIIRITGIKGRGSSFESHANISVNPQFLIRVGSDCFGLYNVLYALPYEACDCDCLNIDVVIIGCSPEHIPVDVI